MNQPIDLNAISIRTELRAGDIGYIIHLHARLYAAEYNYGIIFETYVASGLVEFYRQYDPLKDRVWVCEHGNRIIGFLLLMHRRRMRPNSGILSWNLRTGALGLAKD